MNIWQPSDFLHALLWALLAVGIHLLIKWLDTQLKADSTISDHDAKICRYVLFILRILFYIAVAFCIGLIALPPIAVLLTALLGKAFSLFDRYGGVAIIIVGIVVWWKNRQSESASVDDGEDDPVDVEYAEQEAAELHEEVCELTYEATVDTSENTPLKRSQGSAGIETGREKPYTMDGTMAIHQFSVDTDTPLDKAGEALVLRELQRHMNQRGKRYPHLCREGRAPIIFDLKNNGNFVIIEVVLYSEKYKGKIEARRKARIARQQQTGDTYDRDF